MARAFASEYLQGIILRAFLTAFSSGSSMVTFPPLQGIYLTLERQADGKNKLLRIRFNRNKYSKKEAEVWWNKSKHGLARAHNLAPGESHMANR